MRNLKNKEIPTIHLNKIFGGADWVKTTSESKRIIGGQEVTIVTTDSFNDANGDKNWGPGESGSMCQSTKSIT